MTRETWFWIGFAGMAAGALATWAYGRTRRTRDEENDWLVHLFVCLIAMASYLAMAVGQGTLVLADGRDFHFARYIDWLLTTPLLLLGLALNALGSPFRRWALLLGLMGADAYMIATGALSAASPAGSSIKWVWFVISCGTFGFMAVALYGNLGREATARGSATMKVYRRNREVLIVLWAGYPLLFMMGPDGVGRINDATSTAAFAVLDVVSKVAYGLFAMRNLKQRVTGDLAEGSVQATDLRR